MSIKVVAYGEDKVHVAIIKRLFGEFGDKYSFAGDIIKTDGKNELIKNIDKYYNGACNMPYVFFILMDMDGLAFPENENRCPATTVSGLLGSDKVQRNNFMLRLAVAEGENWLLADYDNLCEFLSVNRRAAIVPDQIARGKEAIMNLARLSNRREYRKNISIREPGRTGLIYNEAITKFIDNHWQPRYAARHSKSLRRTLNRLEDYQPG